MLHSTRANLGHQTCSGMSPHKADSADVRSNSHQRSRLPLNVPAHCWRDYETNPTRLYRSLKLRIESLLAERFATGGELMASRSLFCEVCQWKFSLICLCICLF